MPDCKLTEKCLFFNNRMAAMPSMADLFKDRFCRSGGSGCARYVVCEALGRENVPPDLYPNDLEVVAINDLFAFITPYLAKVQNPKDVHFTTEGYDLLGQQVAAAIKQAITKE